MRPAAAAIASRAFLLVACLAIAGTAVRAAGGGQAADERLARSSAAAIRGRVVAIQSGWDPQAEAIYTYVGLDVARSWALRGAPRHVTLKLLGGVVGDTALVIGGQARFAVGEDVLVFADVRPRDRTLSVSGLDAGKWTLTTAGAAPMATRRRHDRAAADRDPDARPAAELDRLAALAGTGGARADAALLEPAALPAAAADAVAQPSFAWLTPDTPARWHEADAGAPVYVDAQSGGHPLFPGGGIAQILGAAARWSAAGSLKLLPGGFRSGRCFSNADPNDGRISIAFDDPCGEIADAGSTLAIGGAYYTSSDVRRVGGTNFWKITKGVIVTDDALAKFSGFSLGCWDDLMTHELGHAIGLGHVASPSSIMYPAIAPECVARSESLPLSADDRAGVAALYPLGAGEAGPPGVPLGLSAAVNGFDVTLLWRPPAAGGAVAAYHLQAGSLPGASDYGVATTTETSLVVPNVASGVYYVRLIAANAAGASAPTADITVIVGQYLPGTPSGLLAAAGPGGSVVVHWDPPAAGPVPSGYRLVARDSAGAIYRIPVGGTSFAAQGVASGTYYVRVAAVTPAGAGPVTPEIAVVVP